MSTPCALRPTLPTRVDTALAEPGSKTAMQDALVIFVSAIDYIQFFFLNSHPSSSYRENSAAVS